MAVSQNQNRVDVQHILLTSVGGDVLNVDVLVSRALQILSEAKKDDRRYRSPYYVQNAVSKLEKKGLFAIAKDGETTNVSLTEAGEQELAKYTTEKEAMKPQAWDGKWRLVIFDIDEKQKGKRDRIRRNLTRFGFERLQNSVWAYPYECEDLIQILKDDCGIDKEILYIVSEKIQDDTEVRKRFGL